MLFLVVLSAGETCWHVVFSSLEIFVYDFMCALLQCYFEWVSWKFSCFMFNLSLTSSNTSL